MNRTATSHKLKAESRTAFTTESQRHRESYLVQLCASVPLWFQLLAFSFPHVALISEGGGNGL